MSKFAVCFVLVTVRTMIPSGNIQFPAPCAQTTGLILPFFKDGDTSSNPCIGPRSGNVAQMIGHRQPVELVLDRLWGTSPYPVFATVNSAMRRAALGGADNTAESWTGAEPSAKPDIEIDPTASTPGMNRTCDAPGSVNVKPDTAAPTRSGSPIALVWYLWMGELENITSAGTIAGRLAQST